MRSSQAAMMKAQNRITEQFVDQILIRSVSELAGFFVSKLQLHVQESIAAVKKTARGAVFFEKGYWD